MKKVLSVLLCVAMLCSCISLFAFAEGTDPVETVTYTFFDDDGTTVLKSLPVNVGEKPVYNVIPIKERVDGQAEYEFTGWECQEDHKLYWGGTLPQAESGKNLTFLATYAKVHDNTANGDITLMTFLASIFSRLNAIFDQIALYFEELTKSINGLF